MNVVSQVRKGKKFSEFNIHLLIADENKLPLLKFCEKNIQPMAKFIETNLTWYEI